MPAVINSRKGKMMIYKVGVVFSSRHEKTFLQYSKNNPEIKKFFRFF